MDAPLFRPYADTDREQVIDLWNRVFPDNPAHNQPGADIDRKMMKDRHLLIVCDAGDRIIGTAMGGWDGHRGWIYSVAVDSNWRRQGIGALLMRHAETALIAEGCHKLNLQIREGNETVVGFYESLGYVIEPRVSMGKRLG